jgi:hypothetical protein
MAKKFVLKIWATHVLDPVCSEQIYFITKVLHGLTKADVINKILL